MPWAHVVSGGAVYNEIHGALTFQAGHLRIYEILFAIWLIGMLVSLAWYLAQYCKALCRFREMPQEESLLGQEILDAVDGNSSIRVLRSAEGAGQGALWDLLVESPGVPVEEGFEPEHGNSV